MKYRLARYIIRMVVIGVLSALLVIGVAAAAAWHYRARIARVLLATVPIVKTPTIPLAPVLSPLPTAAIAPTPVIAPPATVASAVAKVNKSVVSIEVAQPVLNYIVQADGSIAQSGSMQTIGGGTGFFVSRSGLILTNRHVVDFDGATFTAVTAGGKRYAATIVAKDSTLDIALLKVTSGTSFPPVTLGNSDSLQLGQSVVAIGYALGQLNNSISAGIVSGLSRNITAGDALNGSTEDLSKLIQTDAAINPGNSGGPLLTLDGNVVGVNVATAAGSQSIGFALPINEVKSFVAANN
ncbi:MAG: putative family peptidase [Candidatus Nomurabacteria bacterium]|nr:putative family peptidase [Candidatus Nomurabacteria bacterium]